MNKQEQIDALRFRIERIEAKFAEQNKDNNFGNRSEIPNSSEAGNNHQLFHIAIHEAISTEPDPYQVDWSKAPEWADSHFYNGEVGYWGGLEYNIHGHYLWLKPSGFTLSKELDWKQSKRRRPN
jgi:hypothetical protein